MYKIAIILSVFLVFDGVILCMLTFDSNIKLASAGISLDCNAAQFRNGENNKAVDDFRHQMREAINRGRKGYEDIGITGVCFAGAGILTLIITGIVFFTTRRKSFHCQTDKGNPVSPSS
ncbi:MAG TPA: hypothetical protein DCZ94_01570 [Lentisphaeria bacterium]|nr:MAG: hypothetical protein A2X48_21450 [Lentisphaerae bacterium GWF2_49_21]HBC85620.1 hypothetical protein [Lentisphaeria bacterium]